MSYQDGDFYLPPKPTNKHVALMMVQGSTNKTFFAKRFNRNSGVKLIYEINASSNTE